VKTEATHYIILQVALDRVTERLLGETAPCFAVNVIHVESLSEFVVRHERLEHCVPSLLRKDAREVIEAPHLLVLAIAAS
jgi:hypothetical protein